MPHWSARVLIGVACIACLTLAPAGSLAQTSAGRCGDKVEVREGDSLSSIAERCSIAEARILDLNPTIEGSKDLKTGMSLNIAPPSGKNTADNVREAAEKLFGRLKSYARETSQALEGEAENVVGSIEDFIRRNPDLHQRVRKLGQRLDIPGMDKVEAQVSLSVRRGTPGMPVTLSAIGLPANQRVDIGGVRPAATMTYWTPPERVRTALCRQPWSCRRMPTSRKISFSSLRTRT